MMKKLFTGDHAHLDAVRFAAEVNTDPTKVLLGRGCKVEIEGDTHWVEWRENYELRYDIAKLIASRQMTREGIDAVTDDILNLIKNL